MLVEGGEQGVERILLEEGVAPGEQEAVELAVLEGVGDRLHLVDAEADRLDVAVAAELVERLVGAFHRRPVHLRLQLGAVGEGIDVVDEEDVDAVEAEALEAVLVGAHGAVIGVVEPRLEGERLRPRIARLLGRAPRLEAAADLGREHPAVAAAELVADDALRLAVAVERRRVEIADAAVEGVEDDDPGVGFGDCPDIAGERRAAEAEGGHLERGPADPAGFELHDSSPFSG